MSLTPPRSLHQQVADDLREAIHNGLYPVGATLPSEPVLAEHYRVSRVTINRAVTELRREGIVEVRRGIGTTVIGDHTAVPVHLPTDVMTALVGVDDVAGWVVQACRERLERGRG